MYGAAWSGVMRAAWMSSAAPCITLCITLTSHDVGRSVRNTPSVRPRSISRSTRAIGSACNSRTRPGGSVSCAAIRSER